MSNGVSTPRCRIESVDIHKLGVRVNYSDGSWQVVDPGTAVEILWGVLKASLSETGANLPFLGGGDPNHVKQAQPSAMGATWRQVPDVIERQVAWIDRDARHVAVVKKGKEYILTLPELP